jgi:hypothetical protein
MFVLLEAVGSPGVTVRPSGGGGSDRHPLCQADDPWLPRHMEVYIGLSIYCCKSFILFYFIFYCCKSFILFYFITDRDWVDIPDG